MWQTATALWGARTSERGRAKEVIKTQDHNVHNLLEKECESIKLR